MDARFITCLECGRAFRSLGSHINRAHDLDARAYRARHDLPASYALAAPDLRDAQAALIRGMAVDGRLSYDHLPRAVEAAKGAGRGRRTTDDLASQAARARSISHVQLAPGAKRADGRDADTAREYQQRYRARKRAK